jgi:hypothetical protein
MKSHWVVAVGGVLAGCGGSNVASTLAKPPAFAPASQTQCAVHKSQARPLVVEWPAADRATLETRRAHGLIVVRYIGCEMEVLHACKVPGAYTYTAVTPKREDVAIKTADELFAQIPAFAARFEGKLKTSGQLNVTMTIVGTYENDRTEFRKKDLEGDCARATHVVTDLTAGAFEFFAGGSADVNAKASGLGAEAGGASHAQRETLNQDGDEKACASSQPDDKAPPFKCGALVRLEVQALKDLAPEGQQPQRPQAEAWSAPPQRDGSSQRLGGAVLAGAGVVGLGLGTIFGLSAKGKKDDSAVFCDASNACDPPGLTLRSDARAAALVSTIAFGAGALALAAGGILFFTAPSAPVQAGMGPGGFSLRGTW